MDNLLLEDGDDLLLEDGDLLLLEEQAAGNAFDIFQSPVIQSA